MPKALKLPLFEYGTVGAYEYFMAHLKNLMAVETLYSEIFQTFREVGNCLLMLKMFDSLMVDIFDPCRVLIYVVDGFLCVKKPIPS